MEQSMTAIKYSIFPLGDLFRILSSDFIAANDLSLSLTIPEQNSFKNSENNIPF